LTEAALERLRFYAPFIKTLDLGRKDGYNYQLQNWKSSMEISRTNPFLPNLVSLSLLNPRWYSPTGSSQLPLVLIFISPSLLECSISYSLD
jgi:hypothetical protein